jgi:hypothetical protein
MEDRRKGIPSILILADRLQINLGMGRTLNELKKDAALFYRWYIPLNYN